MLTNAPFAVGAVIVPYQLAFPFAPEQESLEIRPDQNTDASTDRATQ